MLSERILAALGPQLMSTAQVVGKLTGAEEPAKHRSYSEIYRALNRLADDGAIIRERAGGWNAPVKWRRP